MSKVSIASLGPIAPIETITLDIGQTTLTVTPTIPYENLLEAIQWSVNFIIDDRPFISDPLNVIIQNLAVLKFFTNLSLDEISNTSFTPSDLYEWYDILTQHAVFDAVLPIINAAQLDFFRNTLAATLQSLVAYRNSAAGIVDQLSQNSKQTAEDLTAATDILTDTSKMEAVHRFMELAQAAGLQDEANDEASGEGKGNSERGKSSDVVSIEDYSPSPLLQQ